MDLTCLPPATLYVIEQIIRSCGDTVESISFESSCPDNPTSIKFSGDPEASAGFVNLGGGAFHQASDGYYLIHGEFRKVQWRYLVRVEKKDMPKYVKDVEREVAELQADLKAQRRALRKLREGSDDRQEAEREVALSEGALDEATERRDNARAALKGRTELGELLTGYPTAQMGTPGTPATVEVRVPDGASEVLVYRLPRWKQIRPEGLSKLLQKHVAQE